MDTDFVQTNIFTKKITEKTQFKDTCFDTAAYISLEFNEFGLSIKVFKDMWIKPVSTPYSFDESVIISTSFNGVFLTRVPVFEKNWFCSRDRSVKNLPGSSYVRLNPSEVTRTINLLKTASGKEAEDAAFHLFFELEVGPAYYDKSHWLRRILPNYWSRWEEIISGQHKRDIEEIMTT